jgi:Ran-binding protein 1
LTQTEDEHDPHFEPIIKLTEEVVTKTNEEDEAVVFKLYVFFPLDATSINSRG